MQDESSTVTIKDHLDRCRLCLKIIGESEVFYKINEITKFRFENLTSLEFSLDQLFSTLICANCNHDLAKYNLFRENLIKKQSTLYEIVYAQEDPTCNNQEVLQREDEMVQEVSDDLNENEEILDEEMLECEQLYVEDGEEETLLIESLVESDGNGSSTIVEKCKLKQTFDDEYFIFDNQFQHLQERSLDLKPGRGRSRWKLISSVIGQSSKQKKLPITQFS